MSMATRSKGNRKSVAQARSAKSAASRSTKAARKLEANEKRMVDSSKRNNKSEKNHTRTNGAPEEPSKVKFESQLAREEAVSYFEALVEGMKKGTIQLKQGSDSITLRPAGQVAVEVKASRKGDKEKITFEIAWRSGEAADRNLKISAS
jgi:amphi-Trp domain-containing protein